VNAARKTWTSECPRCGALAANQSSAAAEPASVYQEPHDELTGFGLWVRDGPGFSWEWFVRDGADRFSKLQESGRVRVGLRAQPDFEELEEIRFETDVSLRFHAGELPRKALRVTHRVVIHRGSVLRFPPWSR
jgi:hypothetical protein